MKKAVKGSKIPKSVGPYSQAVTFGNLVFVSGQIGLDPKSGQLKPDIQAQTDQIFSNIKEILISADTDINNVLKVNVYLKDISDFASMNKVYEKHFKVPFPARTTVGVAGLPKNALIEIECIAYKDLTYKEDPGTECCGGCC